MRNGKPKMYQKYQTITVSAVCCADREMAVMPQVWSSRRGYAEKENNTTLLIQQSHNSVLPKAYLGVLSFPEWSSSSSHT